MARVHAIDVLLERGQVRRIVLSIQRGPDPLHHLPAEVLEDTLEPPVGLPAERVVHADGGHAAQTHLPVGVVAERMRRLAAAEGRADDPAHRSALRDVVRRHHGVDGRDPVLLQVGGDGVAGGGEQPAGDRVHLLLLHEKPHLGQGAARLRIGILHAHLHLAARDLVPDLLPEKGEAVGHVLARLRERARKWPEIPDPDGPMLRRTAQRGQAGQ